MDEINEILQKIGLSKQEARAYIGLLELQEARTGRLCKHTGIASSNIYTILESLIEKGLASYRVQNNTKVFMPAPPEALNELFEEKQRQLEKEREEVNELISNLKKKDVKDEPYSYYKYYEGLSGVKAMWHEINNTMSSEDVMKVHTAKPESYKRLVGFYTEHHDLREKKNVKEQLLVPEKDVAIAKKRKNKVTDIRFMPLQNDAEWGIMKDWLFIQYITGKTPRAFLIKDKTFADSFRDVFDRLWVNATSFDEKFK